MDDSKLELARLLDLPGLQMRMQIACMLLLTLTFDPPECRPAAVRTA